MVHQHVPIKMPFLELSSIASPSQLLLHPQAVVMTAEGVQQLLLLLVTLWLPGFVWSLRFQFYSGGRRGETGRKPPGMSRIDLNSRSVCGQCLKVNVGISCKNGMTKIKYIILLDYMIHVASGEAPGNQVCAKIAGFHPKYAT